jgi:hypothetical protein
VFRLVDRWLAQDRQARVGLAQRQLR